MLFAGCRALRDAVLRRFDRILRARASPMSVIANVLRRFIRWYILGVGVMTRNLLAATSVFFQEYIAAVFENALE